MIVSLFELFSIGIGPSSSHTVGPMRAARTAIHEIQVASKLHALTGIHVELFGSLAATGEGHCTDIAILLGLEGHTPEGVDPDAIGEYIARIKREKTLSIAGEQIPFDVKKDLVFQKGKFLPYHSNALRITFSFGKEKVKKVFYSIGGGFVVPHDDIKKKRSKSTAPVPYPYDSAASLLALCDKTGMTIAQVAIENEKMWNDEESIRQDLLHIWHVMQASVKRGCETEGVLPGCLRVKRRAFSLYKKLMDEQATVTKDPSIVMDWVSLFALAVNEENAAGGRIVTAPTNGAAGVIPAVLHYYSYFIDDADEEGILTFLLTAGALCQIYRMKASISAAEVGCQGEVGVACSLAAGGLTAALGGTMQQVEHAAEIGMEHNLGLTCDPIAGLVQIPCIERNTMGAIKAINASRLALRESGIHHVSLDEVIESMYETGKEMQTKYKETSEGGLAKFTKIKQHGDIPVSLPEC